MSHVTAEEYQEKQPDKIYDIYMRVSDIDMTRDGKHFVVSTGTNLLWYSTGSDEPLWATTGGGGVVKISGDGNYFLTTHDNILSLYDRHRNIGAVNYPIAEYMTAGWITGMDISDDDRYFVVADDHGYIYLFERTDFIIDITLPKWTYDAGYEITSICMSGDGNYLAAGTDWKGNRMFFFSTESNDPLWVYHREKGTVGTFFDLDISYNGDYIIVDSPIGVTLLSTSSRESQWHYITRQSIEEVKITPDGQYISLGTSYGIIHVLSNSGKPLQQYEAEGVVRELCITSDGKNLVNHVTQWDVENDSWLVRHYFISKHNKWVYQFYHSRRTSGDIAISEDANYVLFSYHDKVYLFVNENLYEEPDSDESGYLDIPEGSSINFILVIVVIAVSVVAMKFRKSIWNRIK